MRKIFIIAVMLITSLCANCFTVDNQTNLENVVDSELSNEFETGILDDTGNEIIENNVEDEIEIVSAESEIKEEQQNDITQQQKEIAEVSKSTDIQANETTTTTNSKNTQKVENVQAQTTSESAIININQNQTQQTNEDKTITESDLEYWCVSGGSHHIAGDGSNEHGYYSTWDEAYSAFEAYTKNWSSVQFKIDCCACGKYYFWAIQ